MGPHLWVISSVIFLWTILPYSRCHAADATARDSGGAGATKDQTDAEEPTTFDPIGGVVVDSAGRPVPEARVVLRTQYQGVESSSNEPAGSMDLAQTKTDTSGRFDFRAVSVPIDDIVMRRSEPGFHWLEIVVSAPGFALGWSHIVGARMPNIVLRPESKLQGRIIEENQRPVAGADVRVRYLMSVRHISQLDLDLNLSPQNWPTSEDPRFMSLVDARLPECTAKTDADGRFEVRGLPAQAGAVLEINHPDFQIERVYAATVGRIDPAVRANFKRDVQVGEIQASLKRGHHVAVKVVFDDTGKPAAHAKLPFPPTIHPPKETADEQGRFEYRHIANGEFSLYVSAPETTAYLDATQTLDLNDGRFEHDVTVRLTPGVPVAGRVIDRRTKRGIPEVRLMGAGETLPAPQKSLAPVPYGLAVSDKEGAFRMIVPPGKGIVAIRYIDPRFGIYRPILPVHVDYREVDRSMRRDVFFDADKLAKPIVFELTSLPSLRGRVSDNDGKPVPRADLLGSIQLGGSSSRPFKKRTASDGTFELPDLFHVGPDEAPRTTRVLVLDRLRKRGNIIEIGPDAPTDAPLEFSLVPMQTVTGRILDGATGHPIESAKITLAGDTHTALTVRTDAKGMFSITALVPIGRYSLKIETPGYVSFDDNRTNFVAGWGDHNVGDLALRPIPNQEDFEGKEPGSP
jgi:Carboxypeptidase regulatory-like domain